MKKVFIVVIISILLTPAYNQEKSSAKIIDYKRQKEYTIADVKVTGVQFLNPNHLVSISGLHKGQKIKVPGKETTEAIKKYWKYGLFSDVELLITKIEDDQIYLELKLTEQPRLRSLTIKGIKKGETEDIEEKLELERGTQITDNIINDAVTIITKHFTEKGFYNIEIDVQQFPDTTSKNQVDLVIDIAKNNKVKIEQIIIEGNEAFTDKRLRRTMKNTKQIDWNIFKGSKYIENDFKEDKVSLIDFYNKHGYRDASIGDIRLEWLNEERLALKIFLFEGSQYYIRNINWLGNTKYPSEYLEAVLGIKKGDLYDKKLLNDRLTMDEDAVSSIYMDNGYLFFSVTPVETNIEADSVDVELRIYEGKQATINDVTIVGNTKTNEHVVRRELYTRPGELFSRSDIIRSVREIANLGHFNAENIVPNPIPNQADGTVDLEYALEERSNDQLELSGGWGGYYGFVGSIRVRFANFAAKDMFKRGTWRPVPSGDGQTLSVGFQTNYRYHSINLNFVEPWLGGKKPNSFSFGLNYTMMKDNYSLVDNYFRVMGGSIGIGTRLKWPDDFFQLYSEISYQQYKLKDYSFYKSVLPNGAYNLYSMKLVFSRSNQDQPIYPRRGSSMSLSLQVTPPYSLFKDDYFWELGADELSSTLREVQNDLIGSEYNIENEFNNRVAELEKANKSKYIEFHKWNFNSTWYTALVGDFVLALRTEFGYLGHYNNLIGPPPFEKFDVGGSGLSGYNMFGTDVVPLRGYTDGSITPIDPETRTEQGNIYSRYYAEFRYPVTLNPSATVYGLAFLEAGNAWIKWSDFNPTDVKRSVGVGVRAFLPMFGLLGIDYGYGLDQSFSDDKFAPRRPKGEWHFIIGQQL